MDESANILRNSSTEMTILQGSNSKHPSYNFSEKSPTKRRSTEAAGPLRSAKSRPETVAAVDSDERHAEWLRHILRQTYERAEKRQSERVAEAGVVSEKTFGLDSSLNNKSNLSNSSSTSSSKLNAQVNKNKFYLDLLKVFQPYRLLFFNI